MAKTHQSNPRPVGNGGINGGGAAAEAVNGIKHKNIIVAMHKIVLVCFISNPFNDKQNTDGALYHMMV